MKRTMKANNLSLHTSWPPGVGSNIQLFLEYGHYAYQIKGNDTCSNIVANSLTIDTPSTLREGSMGQNICSESSHVANQVKLK